MAVGTRAVLALIAGTLLVVGVTATAAGRDRAGIWAVAVAFLVASLWSLLGVVWAGSNPSASSPRTYLVLLATAVTGAVYYGYKAMLGVGLTERL